MSHHEAAARSVLAAEWRRFGMGVSRFSEGQFLALLVLLIVTSPFVEGLPNGALLEAILLTLVLLSAVVAVSGRSWSLAVAVALVVPAAICKWLHHYRPDVVPAWAFLAFGVLFAVYVVVHHLRFILTAPEVDSRVLCAGVSTYLMLGLLWSFLYVLVDSSAPNAFSFNAGPEGDRAMNGFTAFYYSFVTLTSTGFGDITPVARVARMFSVLEAMTGALYLAILIARLVSLHSARIPQRKTSHDD